MVFHYDQGLKMKVKDEFEFVQAKLCFPLSSRTQWVSILNLKGDELALIEDLTKLDLSNQQVITKELNQNYFYFDVESVQSLCDEMELRKWSVTIDGHPKVFFTKVGDWPLALPNGGVLIEDIYGDQYRLSSESSLDAKSKRIVDRVLLES